MGAKVNHKQSRFCLNWLLRQRRRWLQPMNVILCPPMIISPHDALICIAAGAYVSEDDRRRLTPEHYLKSAAEMVELFSDIPEAIENTIEIAKRCCYRPLTQAPILPQYISSKGNGDLKQQVKVEANALHQLAYAGLERRLKALDNSSDIKAQDYRDRLDYELGIIEDMKFPGYFLIVADFIQWAKTQNIAVGPGRGSGAGSVVAWAFDHYGSGSVKIWSSV